MGENHPWFGVGLLEQKKRRGAMKAWLVNHAQTKLRQGVVRGDGMVFHSYQVGYRNGEHWLSPENFQKQLERVREVQRRNRKNPEFKKKFNAYIRAKYASNPDFRKAVAVRVKDHRTEKPWMNAEKSRRRYAMKVSQIHPQIDRRAERALFKEAARLTRETGIQHDVDHIIPLSLGGWHHHENMQVLPRPINASKGCNPAWTVSGYKSFRDVPRVLWPESLAELYDSIICGESVAA